MALLQSLLQRSNAERVLDLERRQKGNIIEGDFDGSVTGYWIRLAADGSGVVGYNRKEYVTKPIGFTSLPQGTEVELSHANGIYYSKF